MAVSAAVAAAGLKLVEKGVEKGVEKIADERKKSEEQNKKIVSSSSNVVGSVLQYHDNMIGRDDPKDQDARRAAFKTTTVGMWTAAGLVAAGIAYAIGRKPTFTESIFGRKTYF